MNEIEIEAGRFECRFCGDRFSTVGEKKRHIREDHTVVEDERRV